MVDDVVGKAVVEQFALETFQRADNAVKVNKASRQTADTYQASATFLELLEIWGALDVEIQKKVKYAKYHALRIAKALKAGEDPNLSNPQPEPEADESIPPLDPNDPEVQQLNAASQRNRQPSVVEVSDEAETLQARLAAQSTLDQSIHPSRVASAAPKPRQPSVVDAPDEHDRLQARLAAQSLKDESIHPSRVASGTVSPLAGDAAAFYSGQHPEVSPVSAERKPSVGGNYFPDMSPPPSGQPPTNMSSTLPSAPSLDLPSAPGDFTVSSDPTLPEPPTTFVQPQPTQPRTPLDSFQPPPTQPSVAPQNLASPVLPQPPPSQTFQSTQPVIPSVNLQSPPPPALSSVTSQPPVSQPQPMSGQPAYMPVSQPPVNANIVVDEEAMLKAQKHARWAISALNFEDVPTAIREFQAALQTLGAR